MSVRQVHRQLESHRLRPTQLTEVQHNYTRRRRDSHVISHKTRRSLASALRYSVRRNWVTLSRAHLTLPATARQVSVTGGGSRRADWLPAGEQRDWKLATGRGAALRGKQHSTYMLTNVQMSNSSARQKADKYMNDWVVSQRHIST